MKLWYCCDCFQDKCMNKYIYPGLSFSFLLKSELNSWLESTLNEWRGMLGGSVAAHHITRWCKPALPLMDRFTVRSGLQQVNAIMVIPMNINIIITVQTISSPVHHVHRWWPPDHLKYYIIFFKKSKTKISGMPRRTMWPSVRIHHFPAAPKQTGQVPGHKKSRSLCDPLNRIINSSVLLTTFQ